MLRDSTLFRGMDRSEIGNRADFASCWASLSCGGSDAQQIIQRLAVANVNRPSVAVEHRGVVADAQQMKDCRCEFLRQDATEVRSTMQRLRGIESRITFFRVPMTFDRVANFQNETGMLQTCSAKY